MRSRFSVYIFFLANRALAVLYPFGGKTTTLVPERPTEHKGKLVPGFTKNQWGDHAVYYVWRKISSILQAPAREEGS